MSLRLRDHSAKRTLRPCAVGTGSRKHSSARHVEARQQLHVDVSDAPWPIDVDASRIRQVLVNVLANATKYTPAGGSITVFTGRGENLTYCIRVRDTGTGISAAARGRVFDLFVRATSGGNGLGIGLAVAKRLVELHGGTITVTSEGIGRGSEFTVTLPQPAMTGAACSGTVDVATVPL